MDNRGAPSGPTDVIAAHERAEPVIVVDYDPAWPQTFADIASTLAGALGDLAVGIEHIGSTAVPGLAAKPIIDIDVVVRRDEDVDHAVRLLASIGYRHLGDLGIVGRDAFRAPADAPEQHVYVCPASSAELRAHLGFRDALRRRPDLLAAFAHLKRGLAHEHRLDRDSYAEGKSRFIASALHENDAPRRTRRH